MDNPCKKCRESDVCRAENPCKSLDAYKRWKERAAQIREHTQEVMARAKEKTHNEATY